MTEEELEFYLNFILAENDITTKSDKVDSLYSVSINSKDENSILR